MPLRDHGLSVPKQKSPSSIPTPHRGREWSVASNLEDLESKARAEPLTYMGVGVGSTTARTYPGHLSAFAHPQLLGCGSSLAHSPGLSLFRLFCLTRMLHQPPSSQCGLPGWPIYNCSLSDSLQNKYLKAFLSGLGSFIGLLLSEGHGGQNFCVLAQPPSPVLLVLIQIPDRS